MIEGPTISLHRAPLARPALVARLDTTVQAAGVAIVAAEPGTGKTELLAQWRAQIASDLEVTVVDGALPRTWAPGLRAVRDHPCGRRAALVVDHADRLPPAYLVLLGVEMYRSNTGGGTLISVRDRIGEATGLLGLRVQTVTIEGRANTPEPLLRAAIGASPGSPILGFSVAAARQRIETLAWVEHATVERRLPDTIVVNLQERRPFAIWQNQGKFVLVDRDGQTVADQNVAQFSSLPLIVGPGAIGVIVHEAVHQRHGRVGEVVAEAGLALGDADVLEERVAAERRRRARR